MFRGDLFSSIFPTDMMLDPFRSTTQSTHCSEQRSVYSQPRNSRNSSSDIFTAFSRAADEFFDAATRSFFRETEMFPRHFYPNYLRNISHLPTNHRRQIGVTLNGEPAVATDSNTRFSRHANQDPVVYERTRLQWYDSNTRRPLLPAPAPPRAEPSGSLTAAEFAKLPISTYHIRSNNSSGETLSSPNTSVNDSSTESSTSNTFMVPVLGANTNNIDSSPNGAYLKPESRRATLVAIQPIQSSPARGQPECEVCLTEYQNKDRLRHLPCGHAFHVKCIDIWLKQSSTCPKCRAGVRTGLKRLERAHLRSGPSNAPVRAIGRTTDNRNSSNQRGLPPTVPRNQHQRSQPTNSRNPTASTNRPPSVNRIRLARQNRNQGVDTTGRNSTDTSRSPNNVSSSTSGNRSSDNGSNSRQTNQDGNSILTQSNDIFPHNGAISSSTPQRDSTSDRNTSGDCNIATSSTSSSSKMVAVQNPKVSDKALLARRKAVESAVKRLAEEQRRAEQAVQIGNQTAGPSQ